MKLPLPLPKISETPSSKPAADTKASESLLPKILETSAMTPQDPPLLPQVTPADGASVTTATKSQPKKTVAKGQQKIRLPQRKLQKVNQTRRKLLS